MMNNAPTYLRSAARPNTVVSSTKMPTMMEPTRAPQTVPRPPRVTLAKMSSRICEPMSKVTPGR